MRLLRPGDDWTRENAIFEAGGTEIDIRQRLGYVQGVAKAKSVKNAKSAEP